MDFFSRIFSHGFPFALCPSWFSSNHPVRSHRHIRWDRQTNLLCRLEIDDELELLRLFHRKIGGLGAFEQFVFTSASSVQHLYVALRSPGLVCFFRGQGTKKKNRGRRRKTRRWSLARNYGARNIFREALSRDVWNRRRGFGYCNFLHRIGYIPFQGGLIHRTHLNGCYRCFDCGPSSFVALFSEAKIQASLMRRNFQLLDDSLTTACPLLWLLP